MPAAVHEKVDYHVLAEVMPILECDLNSARDVCEKSDEQKKLRKMVVPAFWIVSVDMEHGSVDHLSNIGAV